jgi:hypothetical protein
MFRLNTGPQEKGKSKRTRVFSPLVIYSIFVYQYTLTQAETREDNIYTFGVNNMLDQFLSFMTDFY